jgi:putative ATPase
VYRAWNEAAELAGRTASLRPPKHILNAPTELMRQQGYGDGYVYDHDAPDAFSGQEFFPKGLDGDRRPRLYRPNERGHEREIIKRLEFWASRRAKARS